MKSWRTNRKITITILVLIAALLIVWDIYVYTDGSGDGDTISEVIHDFGTKSWFFLFGCGVLAGHFFWPLRLKEDSGGT